MRLLQNMIANRFRKPTMNDLVSPNPSQAAQKALDRAMEKAAARQNEMKQKALELQTRR